MLLEKTIAEDLKKAMKARDELRTSCLRMLKTSIKNMQVEKGRTLKDEEIHGVISSLVRKGKEAAGEFRKAGRDDLAAKEDQEVEIIYAYLPEQLSSEEIEKALKGMIDEVSADGLKDLGKLMKVAMGRFAGRAQGKEVNEIARKLLSRAE